MDTPVGSTSLEKQYPYASIELDKTVSKDVKAYKPGQIVKIMLVAEVQTVSLRKPDDPDEKGFEGSLSLNVRSMEIGLSQKNAIAELFEEDD